MKPIRLGGKTRDEVNAAIDWYEEQRSGLGAEFFAEVLEVFDRIQANPLAGERFRGTQFRFLTVQRFPYVVYYLDEGYRFWIAAIAHGSRRPGYWLRRKPPK